MAFACGEQEPKNPERHEMHSMRIANGEQKSYNKPGNFFVLKKLRNAMIHASDLSIKPMAANLEKKTQFLKGLLVREKGLHAWFQNWKTHHPFYKAPKPSPNPAKQYSTLITFLGTGNYQETTYRFSLGRLQRGKFFGLLLANEMGCQTIRILGTKNSAWDELFNALRTSLKTNRKQAVLQGKLRQALTTPTGVKHQLLKETELFLNQHDLRRRRFELRLIKGELTTEAQLATLKHIIEGITTTANQQSVMLDITYGFRHLSMLGLLSALYLHALTRGALNLYIYYAMFEAANAQSATPVIQLNGLLHMYQWIRALENFKKDGDYGSFAPLFAREASFKHAAGLLQKAAFQERINQQLQGSLPLQDVLKQLLNRKDILSQAACLFLDVLDQSTLWRHEKNNKRRMRLLAREYLKRRDYLRASLLVYEAEKRPNQQKRAAMRADLRWFYFPPQTPFFEQCGLSLYDLLEHLRHAMTHGFVSIKGSIPRRQEVQKFLEKTLLDENAVIDCFQQWENLTFPQGEDAPSSVSPLS